MASTIQKPSDEALAILLQKDDLNSLTQLINRYQSRLLRYASNLGCNYPDDIVQETFIKAYQNIQSFNPKLKWSSWIYRIAHNLTVSKLRGKKFTFSWDEYLDSFISQKPEDKIAENELKIQVQKCLAQLPLRYREPVSLFYLEDKSYLEIMDILRLPMGTVSARINRAKKILKDLCQKT